MAGFLWLRFERAVREARPDCVGEQGVVLASLGRKSQPEEETSDLEFLTYSKHAETKYRRSVGTLPWCVHDRSRRVLGSAVAAPVPACL